MIREVKPRDYKSCLDIYNFYIENTTISLETEKLTLLEYKKKVSKIIATYPFLVYEENKEILGFAYLDEFNFRKAYFPTADLTIYVKPNLKHKKIGSMLYLELEKYAKKMGIHQIISLISKSNTISQEFHKKIGFSYVCLIDDIAYKNNQWEGLMYYKKEISDIKDK